MSWKRKICVWPGAGTTVPTVLFAIWALSVALPAFDTAGIAAEAQGLQHYKMISTIEYAGKGQFRNQVVSTYTMAKKILPDGNVQYSFVIEDPNANSLQPSSPVMFSFVIDRETRYVSHSTADLALWARVHNESVKSLKKVTRENIGQTWEQAVDVSSLDESPFERLSFSLTAIQVQTGALGELIAVRALSEPFFIKAGRHSLKSKINSIYLFDPSIENIYMSISVFEAVRDVKGSEETLRHEVATYRTNAASVPVNLSDVGREFARLVAQVGLSKSGLEVMEESRLPKWALSQGLSAAQVANICSAAVCEGALNPVIAVSMPAAKIAESQKQSAGR
jgi:hypothetical protein